MYNLTTYTWICYTWICNMNKYLAKKKRIFLLSSCLIFSFECYLWCSFFFIFVFLPYRMVVATVHFHDNVDTNRPLSILISDHWRRPRQTIQYNTAQPTTVKNPSKCRIWLSFIHIFLFILFLCLFHLFVFLLFLFFLCIFCFCIFNSYTVITNYTVIKHLLRKYYYCKNEWMMVKFSLFICVL